MGDERSEDQQSDVVVRVLGKLEVWLGHQSLPVGHARQRSVLAVLAIDAGRAVPVDTLINRVWGEHPPARARSALRTYLAHLRRPLSEAGVTITHQGGGYLLDITPDVVDLHHFRRLMAIAREQSTPEAALAAAEKGLQLWCGEPLAELDTPWAHVVREHLHQERIAAESKRTEWALACGQHEELLPELIARAQADPLDERVAEWLMLSLYRTGRQVEALARFQNIRQHLIEELGVEPGPRLQALHQRILATDATLISTGATTTTAGVRSPVPRQLPAAPGSFTGRTYHLAALTSALERQGTVVISALGGAGGIGKTWLALTWAHQHFDRFPDGQLFVDLHGFSPEDTPTAPEVAVRGFLEALGVAHDRIPVDFMAQTALYRSLVAERRMLIVLDNAATSEQVVPLLPGGGSCTVLITSRNRLHGLTVRHGASLMSLGVFTDAESRALLVGAVGADRVAADEHSTAQLVALCGGFPLALGLIAARVQLDLSLDEAVTELRTLGLHAFDADDPTASLPVVLSWSLRNLTDEQRTVFALLGIAPGPDISLSAASSLAGLPESRTRTVLRALTDASLINYNPGGRYAMHDLVRAYATTLARSAPEPVREAALERVVDFYLHTAHAADRLVDPHGTLVQPEPPAPGVRAHSLSDQRAALAWLDTEHPHLLAAQSTAATHHRHHTVWHLAWILTSFHWKRGHLHDDLTMWQAAQDSAIHLSDPVILVQTHRQLGNAYSLLGLYEEAIGHLNQALSLAEHHHDATQQALAHHNLAAMWGRRGNDRKALAHARHALDLHHSLDQPVPKAVSLNQVGWYAARTGDYDTARSHCQAALTLNRRHRNSTGEAAALDSLGYIDHHTGRHHHAIHHYEQALALFRSIGDTYEVCETLAKLGQPYAALKQYKQACRVWGEAFELYRQQGRDHDAERIQRKLDQLERLGRESH